MKNLIEDTAEALGSLIQNIENIWTLFNMI